MSKRWMMVAGALLFLSVAPQAVMAATESTVTLTMGKQKPRGPFGDLAKSGSMAGLSASYRATRRFALGVDYNYFGCPGTHNGDVVNIANDPGTAKPVTITLAENWRVTSLGMYAKAFVFERGRFSPHLRAGAATYSIRYSQDVSEASSSTTLGGFEQVNKAGVNAGAGLRYRVLGGTSVGLEVVCHCIYTKRAKWMSLWTTGATIGFGPIGN